MLGITIFLQGIIQVSVAFQMRRTSPNWGWMLVSGITGIILGIFVWSIGDLLHSREIARIAQIQRLRQDLGLNERRRRNGARYGSTNCSITGTTQGVSVSSILKS